MSAFYIDFSVASPAVSYYRSQFNVTRVDADLKILEFTLYVLEVELLEVKVLHGTQGNLDEIRPRN